MFTAVLLIAGCALLGLGLIGTIMLLWASWRAPEGHEDAHGFHQEVPPAPSGAPPTASPAPTGAPLRDVIPRLAPSR